MKPARYTLAAYDRACRCLGLAAAVGTQAGLFILAGLFFVQSQSLPMPAQAHTIALHVTAPPKIAETPALLPAEPVLPQKMETPKSEPAPTPTPPTALNAQKPIPKPPAVKKSPSVTKTAAKPTPKQAEPAPEANLAAQKQQEQAKQAAAAAAQQAKQTLLSHLLAQIEKYKHYPDQARRRGVEGEVRINVSIDAAGNLLAIGIDEQGAHPLLAKATRSVVHKIQSSWQSPGQGTAVSVIIPLKYSLQDAG